MMKVFIGKKRTAHRGIMNSAMLYASALVAIWGCGCTEDGVGTAFENQRPPTPGAKHVTVSFNTIGGDPEAIPAVTVDGGNTLGWRFPSNPTRAGYTFDGWYDQNERYLANTPINKDITLIAKWTIKHFNVSFSTAGGEPSDIDPIDVDSGSTLGADFPPNLVKTNHVFDGWFSGSTQYASHTKITANVTLTARWTAIFIDKADFIDQRDQKVYKSVKIGAQTWMAENLNYETESSRCYGNVDSNCVKYGRLYTSQDIDTACPSGWHVPTNAEWGVLLNYVTYVGGDRLVVGKKLKSASGWSDNNGQSGNGTDDFGFSALPSSDDGHGVYWWSATRDYYTDGSSGGYYRGLDYKSDFVWFVSGGGGNTISIRCVLDDGATLTVNANPPEGGSAVVNGAGSMGTTTHQAGDSVTIVASANSGYKFTGWTWTPAGTDVSSSSSSTATITMGFDVAVTANFQLSGVQSFVDLRDGKTYNIVKIWNQWWMAENLNYVTDSSWCYDNVPDSCDKYGRLYTWNRAMTACPSGWRLPTRDEWNTLVNYAGGNGVAGTKLKSTSGWHIDSKHDDNGTDAYGFSALPGGQRLPSGSFYGASDYGDWWTATERENRTIYAYSYRYFMGYYVDGNYSGGNVGESEPSKDSGLSVRCVADD